LYNPFYYETNSCSACQDEADEDSSVKIQHSTKTQQALIEVVLMGDIIFHTRHIFITPN